MDTPRETLTLDPANARVRFSVRWFGVITVRGSFGALRGTVEARNGSQPDVSIEVDSQSVKTGISLRDRHLRGMRFLDSIRRNGLLRPTIFTAGNYEPERGTPPYAFGITNRVDELLNLLFDALERGRG